MPQCAVVPLGDRLTGTFQRTPVSGRGTSRSAPASANHRLIGGGQARARARLLRPPDSTIGTLVGRPSRSVRERGPCRGLRASPPAGPDLPQRSRGADMARRSTSACRRSALVRKRHHLRSSGPTLGGFPTGTTRRRGRASTGGTLTARSLLSAPTVGCPRGWPASRLRSAIEDGHGVTDRARLTLADRPWLRINDMPPRTLASIGAGEERRHRQLTQLEVRGGRLCGWHACSQWSPPAR